MKQRVSHQKNHDEEGQCVICYSEEKAAEMRTKCNHIFCNDCLTHWLLSNNTCPLCRTDLVEKEKNSDEESDDDHEYDEEDDEDTRIRIVLNTVDEELIPDNILMLGIDKTIELVRALNDSANMMSMSVNWKIQIPLSDFGWRSDYYVFGTLLRKKHNMYAVYVQTSQYNTIQTSNIRFVSIEIKHINPIQSKRIREKRSLSLFIPKTRNKATRKKWFQNTRQSKHRYTHRN